MIKSRWVLIGSLLLGACAVNPPPPTDSAAARCLQFYQRVDTELAAAGVISPSRPARVAGFPYLRVNRFFASYRDQALNAAELRIWHRHLGELDRAARAIELGSLTAPPRAHAASDSTQNLTQNLDKCRATLRAYDLGDPQRLVALRSRVEVPSEYRTVRQVLGLYPLTALGVRAGLKNYQAGVLDTFSQPLANLPVQGRLRRFQPAARLPPPLPIGDIDKDALGIPVPTPEQLEALWQRHAPVWEIDVAGDYDLPGTPVWRADGRPGVDSREPVVYRYLSYTRWQNEALLQLNYQLWFDRRPLSGAFDILGGALDGLIWRVSLTADGAVLLYDTIHPCGCYHYFLPSPQLQLRPSAHDLPEPPLVVQSAPQPGTAERIVLRIASASHYLQRAYADRPSGTPYAFRDYQTLYATPAATDGSRSLYADNGLVPGSERRERWLLWPMGIPSPGAMRERGRHATAFVGRRHFDDADLLNTLFTLRGYTQ